MVVRRRRRRLEKALPVVREFADAVGLDGAAEADDEALLAMVDKRLGELTVALRRARIEASHAPANAVSAGHGEEPLTVSEILATLLRQLREESGCTQALVATHMKTIGFHSWERITVAETESGKRRPSWEELFGFAILFGVPVAALLSWAEPGTVIELNPDVKVRGADLQELAGLGLGPGKGAATLPSRLTAGANAIDVEPCSPDDWRPAVDIFGERESKR